MRRGVSGLDFAKTEGHMVRACMEGVALSLKHNLEVAKESRSRCGSSPVQWEALQILFSGHRSKSDITGKTRSVVPSSYTATTLVQRFSAGVELLECIRIMIRGHPVHKMQEEQETRKPGRLR